MKQISVAQLRQNPAPVLAAVERGEEYVIVRYRQEVARLVPPVRPRETVSADAVASAFHRTPVDSDWADDLRSDRAADLGEDPWGS